MYKYHQVTLVVEPKKKQLAEAQASLDITMQVNCNYVSFKKKI